MAETLPIRADHVPFNQTYVEGRELYYMAQAVALGRLSSDGAFTQLCCELLQNAFDIHRVLLTPSCTAALEMAADLCEVGPGDEVIMPSYTFVSTANAFVRLGATPVFVDIRADTLNLDESLVEDAITERTRTIVPVHYAGVACEMDALKDIAARHRLRLVEDAAQGVNARYHGRALGSLGDLGCYSFHSTKNYVCGEGGALCLGTPEFVERAEIIRDKGTNRRKFFRGEVDKYTWVDIGSSYVPSELVCAFLYAQLQSLEQIGEHRCRAYEFYEDELQPLADEGWLEVPSVPSHCQTNHHLFAILLRDGETRDALMDHLRASKVDAVFHYIPLHNSPMGQKVGIAHGELPVTVDISPRLLRLPLYAGMPAAAQKRVTNLVKDFLAEHRQRATIRRPMRDVA